jgi:hypothetical protein
MPILQMRLDLLAQRQGHLDRSDSRGLFPPAPKQAQLTPPDAVPLRFRESGHLGWRNPEFLGKGKGFHTGQFPFPYPGSNPPGYRLTGQSTPPRS